MYAGPRKAPIRTTDSKPPISNCYLLGLSGILPPQNPDSNGLVSKITKNKKMQKFLPNLHDCSTSGFSLIWPSHLFFFSHEKTYLFGSVWQEKKNESCYGISAQYVMDIRLVSRDLGQEKFQEPKESRNDILFFGHTLKLIQFQQFFYNYQISLSFLHAGLHVTI